MKLSLPLAAAAAVSVLFSGTSSTLFPEQAQAHSGSELQQMNAQQPQDSIKRSTETQGCLWPYFVYPGCGK